ncbi:auxin response factor 17 [Cornus florida]|uniref:auxin response factor 17 n=1 Tax=Cornus florida TaxID=4283 RepID=UPI0028A0BC2E|nr:auxin response factor 17 [Cornus florida]
MATGTELRQMDPSIWKACAGTSVQIPTVDSRVYYFPQGHSEQSSSPPLFSPLVSSQPMILCRVIAVRHLANPDTDEVLAKIRLLPVDRSRDLHLFRSNTRRDCVGEDEEDDEEKVVSFAKILTPSDANNGGGFSVPRFCADSIFPPLNFSAEPPVQTISIRDVQGTVWEFRHIYRGTPRRHLLTTGWSKFVNNKKLVAGDSVVFMRNRRSGEHFVGIRRAVKPNADSGGRWNFPVGSVRLRVEENGGNSGYGGEDVFTRGGGGKDSAEAVAEAAELAAQGREFEIVYYPRVGWADFVVKAEIVEESLNVFWTAGMRVKMAMETVDSSRMTWFQGTISTAMVPDNGPWRGSPWRMLQVTWDEPEVLQNGKKVNPWLVEYVVPTPPLHSPFPAAKRLRVPQNPGLLTDGEGELFFPMRGLSNSMMGNLNSSLMNYNSFPAGMQGARQDPFCVSALSNFISEGARQTCIDNYFGNDMTPKLKTVSTDLNIGSSQSDSFSPDSQSSVHFSDVELAGRRGCNSTKKVGSSSIQLFGKIIHMKEPVESGFDDVDCTEDRSCKVYKETEGVNNLLDLSLTYRKLFDGHDIQCQRGSAFETCHL